MPNGIITHYEVYYGRQHFKPSTINNITTGLDTSFTTPGHLEPGTEMFFTVTAYTRVGGGEPTTVNMSTLNRPCEHVELITIYYYCRGYLNLCSCCRRGYSDITD